MTRLLRKNLIGILFGIVLCLLASPALALSLYTRGVNAPANSPTHHRFGYTDPFYQKRIAQPKFECRPHGQARCLTPKKKTSTHIYTRKNPAMQQETTVHPYLRKVFKPSIQRIN